MPAVELTEEEARLRALASENSTGRATIRSACGYVQIRKRNARKQKFGDELDEVCCMLHLVLLWHAAFCPSKSARGPCTAWRTETSLRGSLCLGG